MYAGIVRFKRGRSTNAKRYTNNKEKISNKKGVSGGLLSSEHFIILLSQTLPTITHHTYTCFLAMTRPNSSIASLLYASERRIAVIGHVTRNTG